MAGACRKFCVMTTGRSGSTSLMQALRPHDDIALPIKQLGRVADELLEPNTLQRNMRSYEELLGEPIAGPEALIEAFYRYSAGTAFAGFKSMPHRHDNYASFVTRPDIRFITLVRADIPSTVASFMLAMRRGTWGRQGGPASKRWVFQPQDAEQARGILARLQTNLRALDAIPSAIRLTYEDLCDGAYCSPELEDFFGRRIRFKAPTPPISGASYTGNWDAFLTALGLESN